MMSEADRSVDRSERTRIARRYRVLGYDVQENPGPDRLPDFMRGASPDIVARSASDNVVIEVKRHASLKGSNDLVSLAECVSNQPDWRFELVVVHDEGNNGLTSEAAYRSWQEKVRLAMANQLPDMAFIYVTNILVLMAHDLAKKARVPVAGRTDRDLFLDLGFKGILPESLLDRGLSALTRRDDLPHTVGHVAYPTPPELQDLLLLLEETRQLL